MSDYNWLNVNNFKKNDEYYTPKYIVEPIIDFLKPNSTIWCPFDTKESEFVITLKEKGFNVIYTHKEKGFDFFETKVDCDYIISNPPFSLKLKILDRLYKLKTPFALLLPLTMLNYQEVGNFFLDKKLELLIFDKKVSFNGNTASFNTSYFCSNILPKDLMFYHLEHNNSGKHYVKPTKKYKEIENDK